MKMNIEHIKNIIVDQKNTIEEKIRKGKIIERETLKDVEKYVEYPKALVITGVRRCGKTILSCQLLKDKFTYINFDDERLSGIKSEDLNNILKAFYELYGDFDMVVLDEIQNIDKWELFVSRLQESKTVIVTGSNANLLSRELATHLTGRHIDCELFPFSFKEFLKYNNFYPDTYLTKDIAKTKNYLREYIEIGGFPDVYKFGKDVLIDLYNDIITKDILLRYNIKYAKTFKELAGYLISNYASEITYNKLKNILDIKSVHTIKNYVDYLENTYLIVKLERFSYKLKEQVRAPKKIYCIDTGLVNAIGFRTSPDTGKLMENLVAVELLRRGKEIYYWKDHYQREVDFVIKEGDKIKELIQVTYASGKNEIKEREIKGLIKGSSELNCNDLVMITYDYEGVDEVEGNGNINEKVIKYIPLWKWLTGE